MKKQEILDILKDGGQIIKVFYGTHTSISLYKKDGFVKPLTQNKLDSLVKQGFVKFDGLTTVGITRHFFKSV